MRGRIKGESKIEIAKHVVHELVDGLPDSTRLALVVYGHRRTTGCNDIELLIPPGPLDRTAFLQAVDSIKPRGMTPIANALDFAARALLQAGTAGNIVLVTDGLETCDKNPCTVARRLKSEGIVLAVHAVAFDLSAKEAKSLACIASETGGRLLVASDAASLQDALEIAVTPPAAPPPPPRANVREKKPERPNASLQVPPEVVAGATFAVTWTGPNAPGDTITIVPKAAPDTVTSNTSYTRRGSPLDLTALADPGPAEVRYVWAQDGSILARAELVVIPATATLNAPAEAIAGSRVAVEWTGPNNPGDYITIVPPALPDGDYANYSDTKPGSPLPVTAPITAGGFEIRYQTGQGNRVLARRSIQIVPARVTLSAPTEALAGSKVEVTWTGPDNERDYITIVPKGTPDGQYAAYEYTRSGSPLPVTAPPDAGDAEVRYASSQGDAVLARLPIKLIAGEATVSAPDQAVAGSRVRVEWTGPNNARDYITIVPKSARDDQYKAYSYTSAGSPAEIMTPIDAGECEVRYVTGQGNRVLARRPLTTTRLEATLEAPAQAVAGSKVAITWSGPNNDHDYLTIVPQGTADGTYLAYAYTSSGSPVQVTAPSGAGACEIRYVTGQETHVLARRAITVIAPTVDLRAPAGAPAGSRVSIEWTGPNNSRDYITIVAKGSPDSTYNDYVYTSRGSPVTVKAPDQPGPAEIRYNDENSGKVIARLPIELTTP